MRKKSSYFFSANKIARDVLNFCTSTQNCVRSVLVLPETVPGNVDLGKACRCSCGPGRSRAGLASTRTVTFSGVWRLKRSTLGNMCYTAGTAGQAIPHRN